jgi:uncharacterized Zn-finger protein
LRVWKSLVPSALPKPALSIGGQGCGDDSNRIKRSLVPPYGLPDPTVYMKAKFDYKMVRRGEGYVMEKRPKGTLEAERQASRLARDALKLEKAQLPPPTPPPDLTQPKLRFRTKPPERLICKVCNKTCKSTFQLRQHELSHSVERNFLCTGYPGCMYAGGKNSTALQKHILSVHQPHNLACEICGKVLRGESSLRNHQATMHFGQKRKSTLPCNVCDKMLCSNQALVDHMLEHEDARHFRCADCPKRFNTRKAIASHVVWHMPDRPFPCYQCDARFKTTYCLREHRLRHSKYKALKCDLCGEAFKMRKSLISHQQRSCQQKKK